MPSPLEPPQDTDVPDLVDAFVVPGMNNCRSADLHHQVGGQLPSILAPAGAPRHPEIYL